MSESNCLLLPSPGYHAACFVALSHEGCKQLIPNGASPTVLPGADVARLICGNSLICAEYPDTVLTTDPPSCFRRTSIPLYLKYLTCGAPAVIYCFIFHTHCTASAYPNRGSGIPWSSVAAEAAEAVAVVAVAVTASSFCSAPSCPPFPSDGAIKSVEFQGQSSSTYKCMSEAGGSRATANLAMRSWLG